MKGRDCYPPERHAKEESIRAAPQTLRGLCTVSLIAADHAAARKRYTDFLGVEPDVERSGYCECRLGGDQPELGVIDSRYVSGKGSAAGRAGVIMYWHVDEVNAALERAVSMGATQLEAPQDRGHSHSVVTASVVDPFGNILGITHSPHYVEILASLKKA